MLEISDERCRGLTCELCGGPVDQYGPHNYLAPDSPWGRDYAIQVGFAQIAIFDKAKSTVYPVEFKDDLSRASHFACWAHKRVYGRVEPSGSDKGHRAWT